MEEKKGRLWLNCGHSIGKSGRRDGLGYTENNEGTRGVCRYVVYLRDCMNIYKPIVDFMPPSRASTREWTGAAVMQKHAMHGRNVYIYKGAGRVIYTRIPPYLTRRLEMRMPRD